MVIARTLTGQARVRQADRRDAILFVQIETHQTLRRILFPVRMPGKNEQMRTLDLAILSTHGEGLPSSVTMSQDLNRKKGNHPIMQSSRQNGVRQFGQGLRQLGQKAVALPDLVLYLPEPRANKANPGRVKCKSMKFDQPELTTVARILPSTD